MADSAAGLKSFELRFSAALGRLADSEQRKLRLMLSRRWKTV